MTKEQLFQRLSKIHQNIAVGRVRPFLQGKRATFNAKAGGDLEEALKAAIPMPTEMWDVIYGAAQEQVQDIPVEELRGLLAYCIADVGMKGACKAMEAGLSKIEQTIQKAQQKAQHDTAGS